MGISKPIIYLAGNNEEYIIGLSRLPELELKFYLEEKIISRQDWKLFFLTRDLSWGVANYVFRQITTEEERNGKIIKESSIMSKFMSFFWQMESLTGIVEQKLDKIKEILDDFDLVNKLDGRQVAREEVLDISFPERIEWQQVYDFIQGRRLYYSEIRQLLRQNRIIIKNLNKVLVYLKLLNKLQVIPALQYKKKGLSCQRCGSNEKLVKVNCNYCESEDYYCQTCNLMGEARTCRPLYLIPSAKSNNQKLKLLEANLNFELTNLQQEVSDQLVDFLYQDYNQALVWAVCGAGKTEVTFDLIADVLSQGGKVLFAIPRKDVVIELANRLEDAFPEVNIKALYGGSMDKYQWADLVVATTHQVLRYYQAFDLIILDEVDAFPYQGSAILERAVKQAKKPKGRVVYMTATPSNEKLDNFKKNNYKLIKLSARYHGYPLPEPELIREKLEYDKKNCELNLPQAVIENLKLSIEQDLAQVFVFVPSRELVDLVTRELSSYFPKINGESWVQGSHSQDNQRKEKREAFLAGDYPILVSTTIMERGVTVDKANVMVLFAEWDYIFTEETLIQMAGRSGRSVKFPEGRVWFIGNKITEEMRLARKKIKGLNQEAKKKGHLKSSV